MFMWIFARAEWGFRRMGVGGHVQEGTALTVSQSHSFTFLFSPSLPLSPYCETVRLCAFRGQAAGQRSERCAFSYVEYARGALNYAQGRGVRDQGIEAGLGLCFPRSQKRDLGHPFSCGLSLSKTGAARSTETRRAPDSRSGPTGRGHAVWILFPGLRFALPWAIFVSSLREGSCGAGDEGSVGPVIDS
jgi:hypothetical protein